MISFIYYFNSNRIENLNQTLRFLKKNESLEDKEVILVCNDFVDDNFCLPNYKLFNLKLETYNKSKLCNFGVSKAKKDIIALLDADRILPKNYFEIMSRKIRKKQFVSSLFMYKLNKDYEDHDIINNNFKYKIEIKSKKCEIKQKNLFSGNTLFFKKDYIDSGGMDESFEGYGYADNDMTFNILSKGYLASWNNLFEIHLFHPKEFLYKGELITSKKFKKISYFNLKLFKEKWQDINIKKFLKI